ncbi:hypothetical protein DSM104299_04194 [Baekduia alba]|uniref:hypothetical protein n=1 Tax=Baekduia alba TaxID=2997333 RepID=UPI002341694E|nr:hypothetical protein [Baekduia alba]WCB95449.1 hypothetical protein DSM104299_04194 [Baekduia alba]
MHFNKSTRSTVVAALAMGSLAAVPAVSSASAPPNNGVRHIVDSSTLTENGSVKRKMDVETWLDADSEFYVTTVGDFVAENAINANGYYGYTALNNVLLHNAESSGVQDEADPATYHADALPSSGSDTIRGIAVEKRVAPPGNDPTQLHGEYYVNPATGRLVRYDWVTTTGTVVDRTDILTDEVLPDTPANHAQADLHSYPGAKTEEFVNPAPSAAGARKRRAAAHAKAKRKAAQRKAAKHRKATSKHRTTSGR